MRIYDPFDKDGQQRSDEAERETEFPQQNEVGRARAGRLVASDRRPPLRPTGQPSCCESCAAACTLLNIFGVG